MLRSFLNADLAGDKSWRGSRRTMLARLREPWCWPAEPALAEHCRAHLGCLPPPPPRCGRALLVALTTSGKASLWELTTEGLADYERTEFVGTAGVANRMAARLAARDLPFLGDVDPLLRARSWHARLIATEEDSYTQVLDGASFGLAMCLANASVLLQMPLPPDFVASAAVASDGSILPVEGLAEKLRLVSGMALAVERVLVAADQAEEAKRAAASAGMNPGVIHSVRRLAEALAVVIRDPIDALDARWADLGCAIRSAHALHRITLDNAPSVLGWEAVRGSAVRLAERLGRSTDPAAQAAAEMVTLAASIAERHGGVGAPLATPDDATLAALPRPLRFRLLAHVVQSAADSSSDEETRRCLVTVVPQLPPPHERSADELKLAGAVGRAFAAIGAYREAVVWLGEAVEGWFSIHAEQHASHALCEELRVLGVLGGGAVDEMIPNPLEALRQRLVRELPAVESHPEVADLSLGFLRLSAGRALVQAGEPERALDFLDDGVLDWGMFPAHLAHARHRWRARAHDAHGAVGAATQDRAAIADSDIEQLLLARLDEAIRDNASNDELSGILTALNRDKVAGREIARLLERAGTGDTLDQSRFIAEHYRY